jgi:hypothetical protein
MNFALSPPLFTLFRAAYTPSFALRAERGKTKRAGISVIELILLKHLYP